MIGVASVDARADGTLIVQSYSQLVQIYGVEGAKSLRKMLAARIVFPPKEFDDAEAISRELGWKQK